MVMPRAKGCLDLAVSPASIDRSLRILDAILKALDRRGIPVSVVKSGNPRIQTKVLDETIGFRLAEETKRQERGPTAAKKKEDEWRARFAGLYSTHPRYDWVPSGKLVLEITNGHGVRRRWSDLGHRRVEQLLNGFVVGLARAAESVKHERVLAERRRQEWEEQQRRLREAELRRREEERRRLEEESGIGGLEAQIDRWTKAEKIRAYVVAVKTAYAQRNVNIDQGSELDEWLKWALRRADALDPTRPPSESPPAISELNA
jgi:hypothetical protein